MYGIILDSTWDAGQDPVDVVVTGDLDDLRNLAEMDCANPEDSWNRQFLSRIETIKKKCSDSGDEADAHICRYQP